MALAVGIAVAVAVGVTVAGYQVGTRLAAVPDPTPSVSETPTPTSSPPPPEVLSASLARAEPPASLTQTLDAAVAAPGLGGRVGALVARLDGSVVYEHESSIPMTPASTLKILTCVALLDVLGPEHRFETRVVAGDDPGEVVLVGGGDPMLTAAGDAEPGQTSLAALARRTAKALTARGATSIHLLVDDSLFQGSPVDDDWESGYVPGNVVAPVSALAVDGGRIEPGFVARSGDPALAAGTTFAAMLTDRDIAVDGEPARGAAAPGAAMIAGIESAPLADIVERTLATSDNDAAEALGRQVALGTGRPGTADEASAAITATLSGLGVDMSGATILDASGLSRGNAVPPAVIGEVLAVAADPQRPDLRAVISGLPVAGFSGTLDDRMAASPAAGLVRAKTGTLTGVSALAGIAVAPGGTPYLFAALADDVTNTLEAQAALDDFGAALVAGVAR